MTSPLSPCRVLTPYPYSGLKIMFSPTVEVTESCTVVHYSTAQYSTVQYSTDCTLLFSMGTKCAKDQKVKRSKCHRGSLKVRSSQEHISSELVS